MSDILQLIANEQKKLADKRAAKLNKHLDLRVRLQKAWKATGIPEMWERVKYIEVRNFAPNDVAGERVTLNDMLVLHDQCVVYNTGLTLYANRNSDWVRWECDEDNTDKIMYRYMDQNKSRHCETLEEFQQTFIAWFARKIDPTTIAELGFEPKVAAVKSTSRRILAETAAE